MGVGTGYCDYHEKVYKASHSCERFLARESPEGRAYKSQMYGGGADEGEEEMEDDEY